AVVALAEKLTPVPPITDPKLLDRIVADLDDPVFAVREKASQDLDALGEAAVGGVRERVKAAPSAEVRRRAHSFLKTFGTATLSKARLWEARAFEWLSTLDTPEGTALVKNLAAGAAGAWRTEQAKQILNKRQN